MGLLKIMLGSVAAAAATTHATAAKAGLARKVGVLGHSQQQGITACIHEWIGQMTALIGFHADEFL